MLCESLDIEQTVDSTDKPSPDAWLSIFPELNCLFGTVHGILGLGQSLAPKACLKGFLVGSDVVPESRKVDIVENGELSGPKRRKPLTACRQQGDYSRFKVDNFEVTMGSTDEVGVRVGITGIDLPDGQACLGVYGGGQGFVVEEVEQVRLAELVHVEVGAEQGVITAKDDESDEEQRDKEDPQEYSEESSEPDHTRLGKAYAL